MPWVDSTAIRDRSPYWCGYIQHLVQYLVPPCWFGRPEADPPDLSPGRPTWCQHVPEMARGMVTMCQNSTADDVEPRWKCAIFTEKMGEPLGVPVVLGETISADWPCHRFFIGKHKFKDISLQRAAFICQFYLTSYKNWWTDESVDPSSKLRSGVPIGMRHFLQNFNELSI